MTSKKSKQRDNSLCLGKDGNLPTDETSLAKRKGDFTMTMTREQAIRTYVEHLTGDDLAYLLQRMNAYDGCFDDEIYFDMDEFDEFMSNYSPMEIAQMVYFGGDFNPEDDYFRFTAYGNLESADWCDVEADAEDLVDDIIDHLVNHYDGDTPWPELDYLADSDNDALFHDDFEEVETEG